MTEGPIVSDPEIAGRTLEIKGARVLVFDLAASVAAGISRDRILATDLPLLFVTQRRLSLGRVIAVWRGGSNGRGAELVGVAQPIVLCGVKLAA